MSKNTVFISYVSENAGDVKLIREFLIDKGIDVWLDRENIQAGSRWKDSIRKAIKDGLFFLACFSKEYCEKGKSYMNEELTIAIEELRLRPHQSSWFIPLKLNDCILPERNLGAGELLSDLQWLDLSQHWLENMEKLCKVILPSTIDFTSIYRRSEDLLLTDISRNRNRIRSRFNIGLLGLAGSGRSLFARALGAIEYFEGEHSRPVTGEDSRVYHWINGIKLIDLPNPFQSLFGKSQPERIREYILREIDVIGYMIDVSHLGRIYSGDIHAVEAMKRVFAVPLFIILNKIDLLEQAKIHNGISYIIHEMGVPVFPVSAYKGTNLKSIEVALMNAQQKHTSKIGIKLGLLEKLRSITNRSK